MGEWLSLMEFATRNSVSLSTLRRQIKSGKVEHRSDGGKYFIWDPTAHDRMSTPPAVSASHLTRPASKTADDHPDVYGQLQDLQNQLKKAREEIAELKTLLAFYEEQPSGSGYSV